PQSSGSGSSSRSGDDDPTTAIPGSREDNDDDGDGDKAVEDSLSDSLRGDLRRTATTTTSGGGKLLDGSSAQYSLQGVLVHAGGANSGHYFSILRTGAAQEWHEFNDDMVTPISNKQ
ncbi:hypothetical protein GUF51_08615, partial [Xanthomonas citri pv. citri]|nr:hypothetical protein [Xanthomonas citri pv. citri]